MTKWFPVLVSSELSKAPGDSFLLCLVLCSCRGDTGANLLLLFTTFNLRSCGGGKILFVVSFLQPVAHFCMQRLCLYIYI